MAMQFSFTIV